MVTAQKTLTLTLIAVLLSNFFYPIATFAQTRDCGDPSVLNTILYDTACKAAMGGNDQADQACKAIQCALDNANSQPSTSAWYNPSLGEFSRKVFESPDNEIFGERYTYAQVTWILNSVFSLFLPRASKMEDVINLFTILDNLQAGQLPTELQPVADLFNYPFTHPVASGKAEIMNMLSNFQIVSSAQAQGVGFTNLNTSNNIRTLWSVTRNMSYLVSIALLIAAGFMVMFRARINPQTVVSLQMILPKLVVSIILITFSFAIVGFVIDLVYVSLAAFMGFLSLGGITTNLAADITTLTTAGSGFVARVFLGAYLWIVAACLVIMLLMQNVSIHFNTGGPAGRGILNFIPGLIYVVLGILVAVLVWAVIAAVRIVVTLFHAYVNLIILIITGPLQIMMDIFPGGKGFVPWIKCVIGNASVFVVTGVLVVMASILFNFGAGRTGLNLTISGLNPGINLPFVGGGVFLLGDITAFGGNAGWLLSALFLPMAFFGAMPKLMTSLRDSLCKTEDPGGQIAEAVNNMIKQISGKPLKGGQRSGSEYSDVVIGSGGGIRQTYNNP